MLSLIPDILQAVLVAVCDVVTRHEEEQEEEEEEDESTGMYLWNTMSNFFFGTEEETGNIEETAFA